MSVETKTGTTVPVPCRVCDQGSISFTVAEGIHYLPCPKCGQKTKVQVVRNEDRWEIRTGSDSGTGTQVKGASLEPPGSVDLKEAPTPMEIEEPMPKTKLTEQKRAALRGEIQTGLKAKILQVRIFEDLSKKYGVSPETIRYHMKRLMKKARPEPKKRMSQASPKAAKAVGAMKGKAPRKAKKAPSRPARKTSAKATSNGLGTLRVSDAVKGLTAKDLERALEARKLLPALEASRASAVDLRTKARQAERQTARLERQFKKLVR